MTTANNFGVKEQTGEHSTFGNGWQTKLKVLGKDLVAGTIGGVACLVAGHPCDTIKTRMQTEAPTHYKGAIDCLKQTFRQEGFLALYKGGVPTLASMMAENAILFVCYGQIKDAIRRTKKDPEEPLSVTQLALAGGAASFFSSFSTCPTELIKCRLQIQGEAGRPTIYKGTIDCVIKTVQAEGVQGLFKGLSSTIIREVPGNIAFFGGYELTRHAFAKFGNKSVDQLTSTELIVAGGNGGVSFWVLMYPFDTIKSRIQTNLTTNGQVSPFFKTFSDAFKTEGLKGLYRGAGVTIFRAFPANAALFLAYEHTKRLLAPL